MPNENYPKCSVTFDFHRHQFIFPPIQCHKETKRQNGDTNKWSLVENKNRIKNSRLFKLTETKYYVNKQKYKVQDKHSNE